MQTHSNMLSIIPEPYRPIQSNLIRVSGYTTFYESFSKGYQQ